MTACLVNAQDSLKSTVLSEVVVSATRTEKSIIEVPRSVSVINRSQLEKSIYNSVGELLSKQQGLYIVGATQTPGTNQSLFMRGANSNQVVVLIDGMRITDPSTPNSGIDLAELSLTNVEQIEIIRGSHSTVYGGSAIGGVVNIITRKNQKPGFHGSTSLQAGFINEKAPVVSNGLDLSYTLKNGLYFNGSLTGQYTNGVNATIDTIRTPGVFKTTDKDGFTKTDAYLKAGYNHGNWTGNVSFKKTNQHADIDKGIFADDDNNYVDFERGLLSYQLGYALNKSWQAVFQGSRSTSERVNEDDSSRVDANAYNGSYFYGKYTGELLTNEIQFNYTYEAINGVIGVGLYNENMHFNTYYFSNAFGPFELITNYDSINTTAKTRYAFGQINWTYNKAGLSAGMRFSNHLLFGNSFTFEINPSYRFEDFILYGSVSSGYNAPSLYQLFDPTQDFGSYTNKGNKNLRAEESVSFEIGVKKEFVSGSYFTASAFQTQVKNSIEYVYLWNKNTNIPDLDYTDYRGDTYLNITRQQTKGLELSGHVNLTDQLYVNANLSWMTGELTFTPESIDVAQTGGNHVQLFNYGTFVTKETTSNKLVRRPKVTSSAELGYSPIKNLAISVLYRYSGSRPDSQYDFALGPYGALGQSNVSSYHLVDFNVYCQLSKVISVGARIENLFDREYQEIIGFQTRGRSAYLKAAIKW